MLKLIEEKDHNNVNHQEKNLRKAEIIAIFRISKKRDEKQLDI